MLLLLLLLLLLLTHAALSQVVIRFLPLHSRVLHCYTDPTNEKYGPSFFFSTNYMTEFFTDFYEILSKGDPKVPPSVTTSC